jgi:hypothetical protein
VIRQEHHEARCGICCLRALARSQHMQQRPRGPFAKVEGLFAVLMCTDC